MKPPRFHLIVGNIPIPVALLRAMTADYRRAAALREEMTERAARLQEAKELTVAKALQAAHR